MTTIRLTPHGGSMDANRIYCTKCLIMISDFKYNIRSLPFTFVRAAISVNIQLFQTGDIL